MYDINKKEIKTNIDKCLNLIMETLSDSKEHETIIDVDLNNVNETTFKLIRNIFEILGIELLN